MALLVTAIVLAALATVGLRVYERYAGENPLFDAVYDVRLRLSSLGALDRRNLANPRRVDAVVTMTTLPGRIGRMAPTIKSLLNQTVRPAAIRVNVPAASRRERRPYVVPEWLARLRSVTVARCEDFGPATKLLPTLADAAPDQALVVVDDDRIYHRHFLEQIVAAAERRPDAAIASSGWDAPADFVDRPSTLAATLAGRAPVPIKCTRVRGERATDIVQGFSGYLVRPRFFDREAVGDYRDAPPEAFFVDDVWISAHCRAPKLIVQGRRTNFQSGFTTRFYQRTGLGRVNRGDGTDEGRHNTIMLQYFKDRWKASCR
jgi:hypothetical protein